MGVHGNAIVPCELLGFPLAQNTINCVSQHVQRLKDMGFEFIKETDGQKDFAPVE